MTEDMHLDGNAAAGELAELFTAEMTSAVVTCAGCGATGALGTALLYGQRPGLVLRCPKCLSMLACITHVHERVLVDMGGVRMLQM
jgi:glycerate kinase